MNTLKTKGKKSLKYLSILRRASHESKFTLSRPNNNKKASILRGEDEFKAECGVYQVHLEPPSPYMSIAL